MAVVRSCERDIADAALLAAGVAGSGEPGGAAGTAAKDDPAASDDPAARAAALALRAFATHPLVGSLGAARALAAAATG
jgi:hypothetical protein